MTRFIALFWVCVGGLLAQCPAGYTLSSGLCVATSSVSSPFPGSSRVGSIVVSAFGNSTTAAVNGWGSYVGAVAATCNSGGSGGSYWPVAGYIRSASLSTSTANGSSAVRANFDADCSGTVIGASGPSAGGVVIPPQAAPGAFADAVTTDFAHVAAGSYSGFGWTTGNGSASVSPQVVAGAVEFIDDAGLSATIIPTSVTAPNLTSSSTFYLSPWGNWATGSAVAGGVAIPVSGYASNFVVCTNGTSPAANETAAVYVNGAASALAVTIAAGETGRACYVDVSHTVALTAGDYLSYAVATGAGAVAQTIFLAFAFRPGTGSSTLLGGMFFQSATTSPSYGTLGSTGDAASLANSEVAMPISCTARNLWVVMPATNVNVTTFTLMKNGVSTTLSGTAANAIGAQAIDVSHSVSFSQGDLISIKKTVASGSGAAPAGWSLTCN